MKLVKFRGIDLVVSDSVADNIDGLEQAFEFIKAELKVELIQESGYDGAGVRLECKGESYHVSYNMDQAKKVEGVNNFDVLIAKIYKKKYGFDKVPDCLKDALKTAESIELQKSRNMAKESAQRAKKLFDEIRENKMIQNALANKAEQAEMAQAETRAKKVVDAVTNARDLATVVMTAATEAGQSNNVDLVKAVENKATQALYMLEVVVERAKQAAGEMLPSEVAREKAAREEADRLAAEKYQQMYKEELEKQRLENEKSSKIDCSNIDDHMLAFEFKNTLKNGKYPRDVSESPHVQEALSRVINDNSKSYLIGQMAGGCADVSQKQKLFEMQANPSNYIKDIIASSTKTGPSI